MEKIKVSIFDFFAYTLPGALIVISVYLTIRLPVIDVSTLFKELESLNIYTALVLLAASYLSGFTIDSPASLLYYKVGCRFFSQPFGKRKKGELDFSGKRALVIHHSKENFAQIQTWKALKTMSHNLSFASAILGALTLMNYFKIAGPSKSEWLIFSIIFILSCPILLHRASIFDKWHYKDLDRIITALRLHQKPKE